MFFILITPNSLQAVSCVREQLERKLHLPLEQISGVCALGGAARRVVLRVEIQDRLAAASAREAEGAAAGAGKAEVRNRLAVYFQRL
jgi:hypothetical protein